MESQVNVPATLGALLLGGLFASILSGSLALQVIIYFKMYEGDRTRIKSLVLLIWVLDAIHTGFVWTGLWDYLIGFFGQEHHIDVIPWSISYSVAITGVLTFAVQCFFSHRIFMLSRQNWFLVVPIAFLALCRLVSAIATTAEMLKQGSFHDFRSHFHWLFTLGLALSTVVDILTTGSLFFLLKINQKSNFGLNPVIDTLILYAFETGFFTTAGTIVSMICWLGMSTNLIFMGLHFVIAKSYATSLLVTLNTRHNLRRAAPNATGNPHGVVAFQLRHTTHYPVSGSRHV
ncbi:hypothetical protein P691DRAFT_537013 [Macrolepiota fuliginosa MF-IS2]|uniref:DUF6534 domain-containing protein n=1 Tax=Macrolepiota fuliginosa MF-IS2 TaxID=1400762 RepID=A0A9P6C5Z4_9AGAR|nr:hypothetical protein P691DRAFT_537013 [Macrolepiota fuliginosa MF-IS2]